MLGSALFSTIKEANLMSIESTGEVYRSDLSERSHPQLLYDIEVMKLPSNELTK